MADAAALLAQAQTQLAAALQALRGEAAQLRERHTAIAHQGRQMYRTADELAVQRTFAEQLNTPAIGRLRQQETELRSKMANLDAETSATAEALKRLEQLIRQIEMSSTSLSGTTTIGQQNDPWALALRGQIVQGREDERLRLAREVHDGPAQVLANVLMGLEHAMNLQQSNPGQLEAFLNELRSAARQGLHEVRGFIADLRPGALEQGFPTALADYVQKYQQTTKVKVSIDLLHWPNRLPAEAEIVLYRVTQEALQNIHKHARNANVLIRSMLQGNLLIFTIRDDGPGFDPRNVVQRSGKESWGLTSMRERVALLGGDFAIASRLGAGTEVTIRITI